MTPYSNIITTPLRVARSKLFVALDMYQLADNPNSTHSSIIRDDNAFNDSLDPPFRLSSLCMEPTKYLIVDFRLLVTG